MKIELVLNGSRKSFEVNSVEGETVFVNAVVGQPESKVSLASLLTRAPSCFVEDQAVDDVIRFTQSRD